MLITRTKTLREIRRWLVTRPNDHFFIKNSSDRPPLHLLFYFFSSCAWLKLLPLDVKHIFHLSFPQSYNLISNYKRQTSRYFMSLVIYPYISTLQRIDLISHFLVHLPLQRRILKINNSGLIITKINSLFCGSLKINYLTWYMYVLKINN